ncbi:MAG: hypothetical protein HY899_01860 [Deltaproteobacteria bacterium]|nr:hypothetical protein [Deltaproteobacteria bacterium]
MAIPEGGESAFRELIDTVNQAVAWLSDSGLTFDRLRLGQYRRDVEDLVRADESGNLPDIVRERVSHRLASSLLEAAELRRLYKGLVFFADGPLEPKLRDLLRREGGAADEHARNSTENPRDLGLEITLAARLSASGFGVEIDTDGQFEANVGGRAVVFDCTRLHSARDIGARVRDAQKRLADRCVARPEARGILALAITRMEELDLDFLTSPDPMQLSRRLAHGIDLFLHRYAHLWARPADPSLIGVWVYVSRPVLVGTTNRLAYAQRFALESVPFIHEADDNLLWLIDQRFRFLAELTAALL